MKKIKSKGLDDTRIFIENEQSELDLKEEHAGLLNKTVLTCLQDENVEIGCEINILITNDASIRQGVLCIFLQFPRRRWYVK